MFTSAFFVPSQQQLIPVHNFCFSFVLDYNYSKYALNGGAWLWPEEIQPKWWWHSWLDWYLFCVFQWLKYVDGNIVSGHNYIEGNDDTTDDRGHGSMLAEIILSYAPDCTLIPLKVSCADPKASSWSVHPTISETVRVFCILPDIRKSSVWGGTWRARKSCFLQYDTGCGCIWGWDMETGAGYFCCMCQSDRHVCTGRMAKPARCTVIILIDSSG